MNVPGLTGYLEAQQQAQSQQESQLRQAIAVHGLLASLQKQKQEQAVQQALASSGGDVEKAAAAALQAGDYQAAAHLAPLAKIASDKRKEEEVKQAVRALNAGPKPQAQNPMVPGPGASVMAGSGSVPAQPSPVVDPRQARIAHIDRLSEIYANNPVVMQRLQAERDKLAQAPKPMVEHNFSVGENQVQPHISFDEGRSWQPIPGSKPSAKFAKMIPDEAPAITPDTLEMDAYRYLTDGTLPPNMGRGQQGAAQATAIRNRAAKLAQDAGMSPDEIRMSQLTNKAQVSAILQLGKAKAQILQFEKTASANAELALQASERVDRTGIPVLNRWIQAGRVNVQGDPEASKFHAATETFVSEYARVMSGGYGAAQTTEGAQNRAHTLLNTANTKEQFRAVVGQLKAEMNNRVKALNDQMAEERQNLRSGIARPGGGQPPAAAPSATPAAPQPQQQPLRNKSKSGRPIISNDGGKTWVYEE